VNHPASQGVPPEGWVLNWASFLTRPEFTTLRSTLEVRDMSVVAPTVKLNACADLPSFAQRKRISSGLRPTGNGRGATGVPARCKFD